MGFANHNIHTLNTCVLKKDAPKTKSLEVMKPGEGFLSKGLLPQNMKRVAQI